MMRIGSHARTAVLASLLAAGGMFFGASPALAAGKSPQEKVETPQTEQVVSSAEKMNQISTQETLSTLKGLSLQAAAASQPLSSQSPSETTPMGQTPGNWGCTESMEMRYNSSGGEYLRYHYFCEEMNQPSPQEQLSPAVVYQHLQDIAKPYQDNLACQNQQFTINGQLVQTGVCSAPDPGGHGLTAAPHAAKHKKVNKFVHVLQVISGIGLTSAKVGANVAKW
jgi:hypothetical protein